jgi:predicted glycoside hydrolase/deacetylase ChbG (UPF0249 family)
MRGAIGMHDDVRLIVNADDFGLSPGVSRGIRDAATHGIVTSVSVMTNLPEWSDTAVMLRELPSGVAIGLHVNLTAGSPITRARTLTSASSGRFLTPVQLAARAALGRIDPTELGAELRAQWERLVEAGVRPSHIDGHQHVHSLPQVWAWIVANVAPCVSRVRMAAEPVSWRMDRLDVVAKKVALVVLTRRGANGPLPRVTHLRGLSLFGRPDFQSRLLDLLDALPAGMTELMVHPGYVDPVLRARDGYHAMREVELHALTSAAVRDRIEQRGIHLDRASTLVLA